MPCADSFPHVPSASEKAASVRARTDDHYPDQMDALTANERPSAHQAISEARKENRSTLETGSSWCLEPGPSDLGPCRNGTTHLRTPDPPPPPRSPKRPTADNLKRRVPVQVTAPPKNAMRPVRMNPAGHGPFGHVGRDRHGTPAGALSLLASGTPREARPQGSTIRISPGASHQSPPWLKRC